MPINIGKTIADSFTILFKNRKIFLTVFVFSLIAALGIEFFGNQVLFVIPCLSKISNVCRNNPGIQVTFPFIFVMVLNPIVVGITLQEVFNKGKSSIMDLFSKSVTMWLNMITTFLLFLIAVVVGTLLFVIPGIYLFNRLFLSFAAIVNEDPPLAGGIGRSLELTKGNFFPIFTINLMTFAILIAAVIILSALSLPSVLNNAVIIFLSYGIIISSALTYKQITGK